jgi:hypothetical protein
MVGTGKGHCFRYTILSHLGQHQRLEQRGFTVTLTPKKAA